MAEAAKLDAAVERAKHLEDKLKKREAKISDITNQLLVSREKNCKLEEQIASLVPLKLEVMARRSEVKSHKRTAEEQTHKSEELKAETTQLKLELAHAQKVAGEYTGNHSVPPSGSSGTGARRIARIFGCST